MKRLFIKRLFIVSGVLLASTLFLGNSASAQRRPVHYFQSASMPPGTVGQSQTNKDPRLRGHVQTVEVSVPKGARVSIAMDGDFTSPQPEPLLAGMLIGPVYHFKVTQIPFHEGKEVFPTVELVNRLYTPQGKEIRFPVPIELSQEEIEMALEGLFVTRVVYLEDPQAALPRRQTKREQPTFDVPSGEDPLFVADQLGRPMAIVRMGSRVPDANSLKYGYPPVIKFEQPEAVPSDLTNPDTAVIRETRSYPRIPFVPEGSRVDKLPPVIKVR